MIALLALGGCRHLTEAPSGLEDSLRFLYREFYSDDDTVAAGLTGLLDWIDQDGAEMLGERADLENVGAFELGPLDRSDLVRTPVEEDPDPSGAPGVVSVASMACRWERAEGLLVRGDQDVVFEGTWDLYDRAYGTSREVYEAARDEGIDPVRDEIPEDGLGDQASALLLTDNTVEASELGYTLSFDVRLQFRHGLWEVQGEERPAFLILGYMPAAAWTDGGETGLRQSYSIDVNIEDEPGSTLRVFGAWSEMVSPLLPADSPMVLASGVNKAQDTAERLSRICAGELEIAPER
jgi:hypothetical protein